MGRGWGWPPRRVQKLIIGDYAAGNYSEFDSLGRLRMYGDARPRDDQQVTIGAALPGAAAPSDVIYKSGRVKSYSKTLDQTIHFDAQVSHSYDEASELFFHIHVIPPDNLAGDVVWQFTHSLAAIGAKFPAETTVTHTQTIPINSLDDHIYVSFGSLGLVASGVSAGILCSLSRLGSNVGDTYDNVIYQCFMDFHFLKGRLGDWV